MTGVDHREGELLQGACGSKGHEVGNGDGIDRVEEAFVVIIAEDKLFPEGGKVIVLEF